MSFATLAAPAGFGGRDRKIEIRPNANVTARLGILKATFYPKDDIDEERASNRSLACVRWGRPPSPQCACYPEWLLLGMPKCGTQSLADQLLRHRYSWPTVRATTARRVSGMKLRPALFLSP